jgi:hypothetical protein
MHCGAEITESSTNNKQHHLSGRLVKALLIVPHNLQQCRSTTESVLSSQMMEKG